MPGNRKIYEQAMTMGHSAAWDQEWDRAIAAYGRAVQEFPEDPTAHNSLGLALMQARRLEDALKVYTRAHQLANDDPVPLERSADVLERLGRLKEAAQQYINVAEVYLAQRDLEKAIGNWERATRLTPGLIPIHQRLAVAYERTGQKKAAVREYLTLAFNFQRASLTSRAQQAVQRALRLEPTNPQALNTLRALEDGALIPVDVVADDTPGAPEPLPQNQFTPENEEEETVDVGESDPRGPLGEAIEHALAALAEFVFESGNLDAGGANAIQAVELQRQGAVGAAIHAYQTAIQGRMSHAAVFLNLGAMQLENQDYQGAIMNLEIAARDGALAPGAMHGLIQAHTALGHARAAARQLIQTLRLVDTGLAISAEESEQISAVYDRLTAGIEEADEQVLMQLNRRYLERLTGPDWKQRVAKTRRQLEDEIGDNTKDLLERMIYMGDAVTEGLNQLERYTRNGLYALAMDQAHYLLESAPNFMPIHERIGHILLERNMIQDAMIKYNLVADVYRLRGEIDRAIGILREAVKIAPMDISLHESLIKLLESEGRWGELLDQYIDLADAYYQLADLEGARSTCKAAIQLAQREGAPKEQVILLMHRLGEIDVNSFELRQAMRTYDQIRKLDPADDRARRQLVDLNYRLNDPISAVQELDGLLRVYARQRKAGQIIKLLEEQVTRYPQDMALRSRLAAVYRQTGSAGKAVEQLDALAELQLEAGMHKDAVVTVRQIIALNPEHADTYRRFLEQMSGQ
ncbi:MAG: tetratricopeptide repeat protein [Anaerolineae bacterium]|nr:tetratricopeptide repeat protein [Anaerolineae bacterium]